MTTVHITPVAEQARALLQERLAKSIDAWDLTVYDDMLDEMVDDIDHLLRGEDDAEMPARIAELEAKAEAAAARIAELEAAVVKAEADAKAYKAAVVKGHKAATVKTLKGVFSAQEQAKTKSGGERKANPYSSFMALLKHMASVDAIAEAEITVNPQFSETALKSKERYDENRDKILHDGQPLHGQTVTLQQAYDSITAASEIDPLFKNAAVRTAILWAMLSVEQRKEIVSVGREHGLCR